MNKAIKQAIKEAKADIKFLKLLLKDFDEEWDAENYKKIKDRIDLLEKQVKAARRIK